MAGALDAKRLLEAIAEGIGQPLYVLDADWRIVLYNDEAARYFGRPAAQMLGRTIWEAFPPEVEHGRGPLFRDGLAARRQVKGEAVSMMGNRLVSYCMFPVGDGLGVTFHDVTARRTEEHLRHEAEDALRKRSQELEAVLETVPTAVWFTYDRALRHVVANQRASELLGLPRDPDLGTLLDDPRTFTVFRDGKEIPPAERPLHRAARGEDVHDELLEALFKDGTRKILLMRAVPLRDEWGEVQGAVAAAADVTERIHYEKHLKLLLDELNHRVKNTLAIVQSIAALTLRDTDPAARANFERRLLTLSAVHSRLTDENWEGAHLRALVRASLRTHFGGGHDRIAFAGEDFRLRAKSAVALSMALHELGINALKYGSLSVHTGRVELDWSLENGRFLLRWQESGGPRVEPPTRTGFGSRMIKEGLSAELQGDVRIDYRPEGVVCTIDAPLECLREEGQTT
jgi:PAS domain S-box-containing protein